MSIILVTGGVRSGKSTWAENQLSGQEVSYLTPGYPPEPGDQEWTDRVRDHQNRRPSNWTTFETVELADTLAATTGPAMIDCLGTWLSRLGDQYQIWERPPAQWQEQIYVEINKLVASLVKDRQRQIILVTNEVGLGVIAPTVAGRRFADLLGRINQAVAAVADEVVLLVAGRALHL